MEETSDPYGEAIRHLTAARTLLAVPAKDARRYIASRSPRARADAEEARLMVERLRSRLGRLAREMRELEAVVKQAAGWHERYEQVRRQGLGEGGGPRCG
jgi:hypothetical protein